MKIALDVALGLEYLHTGTRIPTIYRDLRCSNILLGEQYNAKLSDLGQAKFGELAENLPISYRAYASGYYAPEYRHLRKLTTKSDIYNHGVVMLQLITGGKISLDGQILVKQARPMLGDEQRYKDLVDTRLVGKYPEKDLNKAVSMAIMSVQEDPESRPTMKDVIQDLLSLTKRSGNQLVEDIRQAARARAKDQASSSSRSPTAKDERCTS